MITAVHRPVRFNCLIILASLLSAGVVPAAELPLVRVTADDTIIRHSCRIEIPPGTVIEDRNGNGVIQIAASGIQVEFTDGSVLRGAPPGRAPDEYRGYGIRLAGQQNVTLRNARISGFWCALHAGDAAGLTLDRVDASDNRRQHLRSTPAAEDGADWLFPHNNDDHHWLDDYGAAIYIERSADVTVRNCIVRHGQNALCLDRVIDSRIYDNDFSFNSGWGIALWRSDRNVISRNALDFCVRGYSDGVYNRGQDSAGILMFEQNNGNIIAENSVTHGGDGFFGFAGREALGETGDHPVDWYRRRGNSDNLLIGNDFSYAPAHGIEMTFSFGNRFIGNRIVGNAICGVWGGYSQDTLIAGNTFADNGGMGYGLERGGVNIEHGRNNRIVANAFTGNKCGVHLWGGANADMLKRPWAKANGTDSTHNLIAGNSFDHDLLVFQFRGPGDVTLGRNTIIAPGKEMAVEPAYKVLHDDHAAGPAPVPDYPVLGNTHPVGARKSLRGRQNIIMTEWGPWDHASPLLQVVHASGSEVSYALCALPGDPQVTLDGDGLRGVLAADGRWPTYTITATRPGVHAYTMHIAAGSFHREIAGTLIATKWNATFFKWTPDTDPRQHLQAWQALATQPGAVAVDLDQLSLRFGYAGPADLKLSPALDKSGIGGDHFGLIARTTLALPAGKWKLTTLSDDGVRVSVDGKPLIDNLTWHTPTRDQGIIDLPAARDVQITVEYFEIDGYATLELDLAPAK